MKNFSVLLLSICLLGCEKEKPVTPSPVSTAQSSTQTSNIEKPKQVEIAQEAQPLSTAEKTKNTIRSSKEFKSDMGVYFRSPSGNIFCLGDNNENGVTCQISEMLNKPIKPKPQDCEFDWGQVFYVDAYGKAEMGCYSDTIAGNKVKVLNYGETLRSKDWECNSSEQGISCKNNDGHGFKVSKGSQSLF